MAHGSCPSVSWQAILVYTQAIELHETAVLYANRAQAYELHPSDPHDCILVRMHWPHSSRLPLEPCRHIKSESYGSAIADADLSLELDPEYIKGYYRRASGNFSLGKYKVSLTHCHPARP